MSDDDSGGDWDYLEHFFERGLHIPKRIIYLGSSQGEDGADSLIDIGISTEFMQNLQALNDDSDNSILTIINCRGGEVGPGWAIFDSIKYSKSPVDILVYGRAYSMGAVILQAGRYRYLTKHSKILVHDANLSLEDSSENAKHFVDSAERDNAEFHKICARNSGRTQAFWKKQFRKDEYFSAKRAVKLGLADQVVTKKDLIRLLDGKIDAC